MPLIIVIFSVLFLTFFAGYLLRGRDETAISALLSASFLYSMVFSWCLFLISYLFNLAGSVLVGTMVLFTIFILWKHNGTPVSDHSDLRQFSLREYGLFATVVALSALILFGGYLYIDRFYSLVFSFWDAIAAYNLWAIDLSTGQYKVGGAAYPILYPGLWSLIYRVQGDVDFWVFSKGTVLIAPVILWGYALALSLERRSLFPVLFLTACCGLVIFRTNHFLQGTMDLPQVILGTLTCLMLWSESTAPPEKAANTSFLSGAVGTLIKQAGLVFFLLVLFVKAFEARSLRQFLKQHLSMLLLAMALPLSFAAFFLYYNNLDIIPKSFAGLRIVAENAAGALGLIEHALQLAGQYMPWSISAPLALLIVWGMLLSGPRLRVVSVLSLLMAGGGFVLWMNFASYDIRNLYWVIILVIFSGSIGLHSLLVKSSSKLASLVARSKEKSQPRLYHYPKLFIPGKRLVLLIPLLLAIALLFTGSERLQQLNDQARNQVMPMPLRSLFTDERLNGSPHFSVITNVSPLLWVPKLKGHVYFDLMRGPNYQRLRSRVLEQKDAMLLLKKLPDGGGFPQVTQLESEGLITPADENEIYSLYRIK